MNRVHSSSALAVALLLFAQMLVQCFGGIEYRPSNDLCTGDTRRAADPASTAWAKYARNDSLHAPKWFDESRVAILIPLHPPKFELAERYLDSARHAGAAQETDLYILLSPEDEASFHSHFPHYASAPGHHTLILHDSGVPWIDTLNKSKGPPDVPVRKKLQILAQFYDRYSSAGDDSLPTRYRYIAIPDSEVVWGRNASGFAAAVARHGANPVFYGNCQTSATEKHQARNSWYTFSQNLKSDGGDGGEYTAALSKLQDRCRSAFAVNTHFVELPIYDVARLPRYLTFLNGLRTVCNRDGSTLGAFEQPLYVNWLVALEGVGRVDSSVEPPSANQYAWLSRLRWKNDGALDAYDPSMKLLQSTGVLWAPLHVVEVGKKCATLPPSVYILFHTDYSESRSRKKGFIHPPCCNKQALSTLPSAPPPYCSAYDSLASHKQAKTSAAVSATVAVASETWDESPSSSLASPQVVDQQQGKLLGGLMGWRGASSPAPLKRALQSAQEAQPAPAATTEKIDAQGGTALEQCLADGRGRWAPLSEARAPPYDLQQSPFYASWNASRWWWGPCGAESVTETWVPAGCGLAPLAELRTEFCRAFAGKDLLLVGDSVQGQLFTSLVSLLGAAVVNHIEGGKCERLGGADAQFRAYTSTVIAHNHHEYALRATACPNDAATISFLRNEVLALELTATELQDRKKRPALHRKEFMCEWTAAAARASVVVLNRGLHQTPGLSQTTLHPLGEILRNISRAKNSSSIAGGGGAISPRIIYRSTTAPRCDGKVELNVAANATAKYVVEKRFNWRSIQGQNAKDRLEVEKHGAWFLDLYPMSAQNGKRKMKMKKRGSLSDTGGLDCVHGCLPGPVDEWARALLALANKASLGQDQQPASVPG